MAVSHYDNWQALLLKLFTALRPRQLLNGHLAESDVHRKCERPRVYGKQDHNSDRHELPYVLIYSLSLPSQKHVHPWSIIHLTVAFICAYYLALGRPIQDNKH